MALNTFRYNRLMPLHFKGLTYAICKLRIRRCATDIRKTSATALHVGILGVLVSSKYAQVNQPINQPIQNIITRFRYGRLTVLLVLGPVWSCVQLGSTIQGTTEEYWWKELRKVRALNWPIKFPTNAFTKCSAVVCKLPCSGPVFSKPLYSEWAI